MAQAGLPAVHRVDVDGTSGRRDHNYLSLFVDPEEARVAFAAPGRETEAFTALRQDAVEHENNPDQIGELRMDLSLVCLNGAGAGFQETGVLMIRSVETLHEHQQRLLPWRWSRISGDPLEGSSSHLRPGRPEARRR